MRAFYFGRGIEVGSADGSALKIKGLFFRSYEIVALKYDYGDSGFIFLDCGGLGFWILKIFRLLVSYAVNLSLFIRAF